jgi:hypothetical protein
VLIEIETFSNQNWHHFGKALEEMKTSELAAQARYNSNYTADMSNPDIKFGSGRRALFQLTMDYGLETYYGFPKGSVRVSMSSPQRYDANSQNFFMTEGTDRNDLVYWLSGSDEHNTQRVGGVTDYKDPTGLAIDRSQRLYIADSSNYRILRMQNLWTNPFTVQIIGTGYQASNGDGQFAEQTALSYPRGLTVNRNGVLLFSDPHSHTVRQMLGENWNLPCGYSNYYWNLLTNPTSSDLGNISAQIECRKSQVKATLLNRIEVCQSCWNGTSNCSTTLRDMQMVLCVSNDTMQNASWQQRQIAKDLSVLMEDQPDCTGCGYVFGCQYAQANYTWNATEDESPNLTYRMTYWLSDYAIQIGIDTLNQLAVDASSDLNWTSSNLATVLTQANAAQGTEELKTKVEALKTVLLARNTNSSMKMAFFKMFHWYQNVVDLCIRVVDSKEIDRRAIIGAQYYNTMSEIASRTFWSTLDAANGTWVPSSAYPKCDFQHPRMFGWEQWMNIPFHNRAPLQASQANVGPAPMLHTESIQNRCCNVNSYICGVGEGPCTLNIDCGAGLVCGSKNCLWSSDDNCCMAIDARYSTAELRVFANKVGYRNIDITLR